MTTHQPAATLLNSLLKALSAHPEIQEIYSFGSINTGKSDVYSDVDLTIISRDPGLTCQKLNETLATISTPEAYYVIFEGKDAAAYTIMLKDYSPYQKVDIGIMNAAKPLELFENSKAQYLSIAPYKPTESTIEDIQTILQANDDNQLMDCLLGSVRYLKHMHRGELWTAYKFYHGFMDQYLKLHLRVDEQNKLSLNDYKVLDEQTLFIQDMIFISDESAMNAAFLKYLKNYIDMFRKYRKISKPYYTYAQKVLEFGRVKSRCSANRLKISKTPTLVRNFLWCDGTEST